MLNYTLEMYILNQTGNNENIIQHIRMATPTFGIDVS